MRRLVAAWTIMGLLCIPYLWLFSSMYSRFVADNVFDICGYILRNTNGVT